MPDTALEIQMHSAPPMKGIEFENGVIPSRESLTRVPGFNEVTRRMNLVQEMRFTEACKLWRDAHAGDLDPYLLKQAFQPTTEFGFKELCSRYPKLFRESITTSDFGLLTSTLMNRVLLKRFPAFKDDVWSQIASYRTVRDFRALNFYYMDGMEQELEEVKETAGFNRRAPVQGGPYTISVKKYEAGFELSWEAVVNDDMGILDDLQQRLSNATYNTRAMMVTRLFVDANGPHASFYTTGNNNLLHGVLNLQNLTTAMALLMDRTGAVDNMPLDRGDFPQAGITLVVGSASLLVIAENIKNMLIADMTEKGGSANTRIRVQNWVASRFNILYNPFVQKVATSSNADTSWWLFLNPGLGRPALMVSALQGYEGPILYEKAPNSIRAGGGLDTTVGDFEVMTRQYKVLMTMGGIRMDPTNTVASDGTS